MKKQSRQEIKALLDKAEKNFRSGDSPAAAKLLDSVLASDPKNAKANEVLGYIYANQGNFTHALQRLKIASTQDARNPYCFYYLGLCLIKLGRFRDAEAPLRSALELVEDFFEARHDLGLVYSRLGMPQEAIDHFKKCLSLRPDSFAVYFNIGRSLEDLGRYQESIEHYDRALGLKQDFVEAWSSRGYVFRVLGFNDKALESMNKALSIDPQHVNSLLNSSVILNSMGSHDSALERLAKAHKLAPRDVDIVTNIGLTFLESGRHDDAIKIFKKALNQDPDSAIIRINLGSVLMDIQKYEDAEVVLNKARKLNPRDHQASYNLGVLRSRTNRVQSALAFFREAQEKLVVSGLSDYRAWSNILFNLNYLSNEREGASNEARDFGKAVSARIKNKFVVWDVKGRFEKLRIGFVSGDFREHPVARFLEGLLRQIDKDRFELYAFPTKIKNDSVTERIKSHFHTWTPIAGMGDPQAADAIHAQGIHILFDLSGHTDGNRLAVFSYKPAPIQVSWLGYFATTGLPEMDYVVGDPYVSPSKENPFFVETIWNLPQTSWCFNAPDLGIAVSELPWKRNGYLTFGSFAYLNKINEDVIWTWARILKENPHAMLLVKTKSFNDIETQKRFEREFVAQGIDSKRLILEGSSSYDKYMETYSRVDVVLDTFPYPGGTTTLEAMWMGVPVLTMEGFNYMSRRGYSINMNASLPEWVAKNADDFVEKAFNIASDAEGLSALRATLRQRVTGSALFDQKRFAKDFGAMLLSMWDKGRPLV